MVMPRIRRWLNPCFPDPRPGRHSGAFHPRVEDLEVRLLLSIYEFPTPDRASPVGITAGPDGNLWFTERDANQIGVMAPDGTMLAQYRVPTANSAPEFIVTGPDGNLWFTEWRTSKIARITPDGSITEFPTPTPNSAPTYITVGPDGNLWYADYYTSQIGRITPDGEQTEFPLPNFFSHPIGITAGPDGNLWFTEFAGNQIGSISPDGATINEYTLDLGGTQPLGITTGPDGNLWFAEYNYHDNHPDGRIGRLAPDGTGLTEFAVPLANSDVEAVVSGPDGNLWFTDANNNMVGSITTDGDIQLYPTSQGGAPLGITLGPDGTDLWFTEIDGNMIGQVVFDGDPALAGSRLPQTAPQPAHGTTPAVPALSRPERGAVALADLNLAPAQHRTSAKPLTPRPHGSMPAFAIEDLNLFGTSAGEWIQ